ncbi:Protein of uncharacterised function (DUF3521) [Escherichia coli]|nr:Protein of uncharacterised function (DUF3521) [Escherichia coli]STM06258.1 Protein of uncharacterised function (DUF3521) [Escherichia coli]
MFLMRESELIANARLPDALRLSGLPGSCDTRPDKAFITPHPARLLTDAKRQIARYATLIGPTWFVRHVGRIRRSRRIRHGYLL